MQSSSLIFTATLCVQLLLAHQALSEDTPPINCKSPKATTEVNYCAEKANEKADLELNVLYKKLRDKLNQEDKDALAQTERKWVALRDEICDFETQPAENGTGWSGFNADCLTRLTKNRLSDLKSALEFRQ
ncbi:lysozyme inhibitor LprI family protein [uncultured Thiodictyon sp.]|uniref:lysozyme inhibitor LprI family protein n=1 Tax=uncultured Thiodictyon sp. TaxID=1846217 RepID=UPI0025F10661|nr:lysozyme inhibitor LprI family protein [uncultured Thiodictyon sp.]